MLKVIKIIGAIGFVFCLSIMYMTEHGIRGIQKYEPSFRPLDMRFHYSSETVKQTFNEICEGGRIAYRNFLVLDFIFIACFLIIMLTISGAVFILPIVRNTLYVVCISRALFDILENTLLLFMLVRYPVFNDTWAIICSWFTTLKFIMLYIWIMAVIVQLFIHGILKLIN